jgi:hypothetical protein
MRIPGRARQAPFQVREGSDQLGCLEGTISASYVDLRQDAGSDESGDRLVRRLKRAPDECGSSIDGDDRRSWQGADQPVGGRSRTHLTQRGSPFFLQPDDLFLELDCVIYRPTSRRREETHPLVHSLHRRR